MNGFKMATNKKLREVSPNGGRVQRLRNKQTKKPSQALAATLPPLKVTLSPFKMAAAHTPYPIPLLLPPHWALVSRKEGYPL